MSLANWSLITTPGLSGRPPYGQLVYAEFEDSETEEINEDNSTCTKIYLVDWTQRTYFLDDLLGYQSASGITINGAGQSIARSLPANHPEFPSFFAVAAKIDHLGPALIDANANPLFILAKITATFQPVTYAVSPDDGSQTNELYRFCERTYAYTSEYLTLQGQMHFVSRAVNDTLDTTPGMAVGQSEKVITWLWVPTSIAANPFEPPNQTKINQLLGNVNSVAFDGHPAGTVLFHGWEPLMVKPRLRPRNNAATGDRYWKITTHFIIKDFGAVTSADVATGTDAALLGLEKGINFIYDTVNKRWDLVTDDGTAAGNPIYTSDDLNNIFVVN